MFPLLCGVDVRWDTPPCSMVVQCISRQFLLFDTILYFVQPSSLRSFPQFLCPSYSFISLPRIPVPALPTSFMPSRWSSSSFSCRTTLQTLSSSFSTRSAPCVWLRHPVLHPPPTSIPGMSISGFIIFTVSPCKWISASWCPLHPNYSVFLLLIFYPRSSIALIRSSNFLSTGSLLVLHSTMSSANMPRPITYPVSCQTGRGSVRILHVGTL